MTPQQIQTLCDQLTENLRPWAEDAARRRADEVIARLLGGTEDDIRHKVRVQLSEAIQKEINATVRITITGVTR